MACAHLGTTSSQIPAIIPVILAYPWPGDPKEQTGRESEPM